MLDKAIAYGGNEPIFYEYGAQSGQGRFLVQVYGQFRANQMAWGEFVRRRASGERHLEPPWVRRRLGCLVS